MRPVAQLARDDEGLAAAAAEQADEILNQAGDVKRAAALPRVGGDGRLLAARAVAERARILARRIGIADRVVAP